MIQPSVGQVWKRGKEVRTVVATWGGWVRATCYRNPQRDAVICNATQWRKWAEKADLLSGCKLG